jgi:hypothetical protein
MPAARQSRRTGQPSHRRSTSTGYSSPRCREEALGVVVAACRNDLPARLRVRAGAQCLRRRHRRRSGCRASLSARTLRLLASTPLDGWAARARTRLRRPIEPPGFVPPARTASSMSRSSDSESLAVVPHSGDQGVALIDQGDVAVRCGCSRVLTAAGQEL